MKIRTVLALIIISTSFTSIAQTDQEKAKKAAASPDRYKFDNFTLDKAFVQRLLNKKTQILKDNISALVKKTDPNLDNVIDNTMKLWNNDNSKLVTIRSLANPNAPVTKHVKDYFKAMAKLKYKNVDVTYNNYSVVSNIHREADGNYHGTISFEQEFTAFDAEGKAVYKDITDRTIEIIITITDVTKDGQTHPMADIFFGNMGVTDVRA